MIMLNHRRSFQNSTSGFTLHGVRLKPTSQEHYCSIIQNLFFKADKSFRPNHTYNLCCHGDFNGVYIFHERNRRWVCFLFEQTKTLLHLEIEISNFLRSVVPFIIVVVANFSNTRGLES